ncbi:MAG: histidine phosphatase family protein [Steroidobacteraceae bacterium]
MRTLILLRHAAAEPAGPERSDIDRPLDAAGRAEAEAAARQLGALPVRPALALASPARRTLMTAEAVVHRLGLARAALRTDEALYLASVPTLQAAIARVPSEVDCLLVVGHNPGLSDLASDIGPEGQDVLLSTGEFVQLALDADDWTLA